MGLHPIGHELGRQLQPQRAAVGVEAAERDRAQPAVEGPGAAIAAQVRANRFPGRAIGSPAPLRPFCNLSAGLCTAQRTPHVSVRRLGRLFFSAKFPAREAPRQPLLM
jgi:hypothetical protein